MLNDCWRERRSRIALAGEGRGDEKLTGVGSYRRGFSVREQVHYCVLDDGVRQWVATDIAALRVPLQKLEVRDEYAMSVTASEEIVSVRHVYHGSSFDTVLVTGVEADVVLDVEFPQSLVVLEGKAQ
jgi:hypothetical protein